MARIFITGSTDGLGKIAAKQLISMGHQIVLHARNEERKRSVINTISGAEKILIGDLSDMDQVKNLAQEANSSGTFDVVIHNAGVYQVTNKLTFAVNSLAPYILTCLMHRPNRLIYLSSGLHYQGTDIMDMRAYQESKYNYADTKLHVVLLAKAISRKWPGVYANAVNPGWVPTKMGGSGAPDDLMKGAETQVWLAVSNDPHTQVSGRYFFHKREQNPLPLADDEALQEKFLDLCGAISGVPFH